MSQDHGEGGAAGLKGLRLLTMDRGPEGYGFHMYTNKTLKGQYVKWVSPNGPSDLAGLLPGDHVLQVDDVMVFEESHHKVVERIRSGSGKGKTLLVIDRETEVEMEKKGEEFNAANALVMIPRAPIKLSSKGPAQVEEEVPSANTSPAGGGGVEQTDGPSLDMSAARPPKKNTRRAQVKNKDWRASIQAYNEL